MNDYSATPQNNMLTNKNILVSQLAFKSDYRATVARRQKNRILIVEGKTDKKFIEECLQQGVGCEAIGDLINANNSMKVGRPVKDLGKRNHKREIVGLIGSLASHTDSDNFNYAACLKGYDEVYGMVDSDYEEPSTYSHIEHLFMTDTSDLETLILSTDGNVLERVERSIDSEEIKKAFTWAYQYAKVKRAMINNVAKEELPVSSILSSSSEVEFSRFITEDGGLNMMEMLDYMCEIGEIVMSVDERGRMCTNIIVNDMNLKKKFDMENFSWHWSDTSSDASAESDFWNVVNGHTLLNMLKICNSSVALRYSTSARNGVDRKFEFDLIEKYDYTKFRDTTLCKKLSAAQLIKSAPAAG